MAFHHSNQHGARKIVYNGIKMAQLTMCSSGLLFWTTEKVLLVFSSRFDNPIQP